MWREWISRVCFQLFPSIWWRVPPLSSCRPRHVPRLPIWKIRPCTYRYRCVQQVLNISLWLLLCLTNMHISTLIPKPRFEVVIKNQNQKFYNLPNPMKALPGMYWFMMLSARNIKRYLCLLKRNLSINKWTSQNLIFHPSIKSSQVKSTLLNPKRIIMCPLHTTIK